MIFFVLIVSLLVNVITYTDAATFYQAPSRGGTTGITYNITCPRNGVITGIKYRSGSSVLLLGFRCQGSDFVTSIGSYGATGTESTLDCPYGKYISSIYGKSSTKLDRLGIRCRDRTDMSSTGVSAGEIGATTGTTFDDLAYAVGARPCSILVRATNTEVTSIQVTYGNIPVDGLPNYNTWYNEIWADRRGTTTGSMYSFVCPNEGVLTGITYRSGSLVDAVGFICTSALGETILGPYGGTGGGGSFEERCPTGLFVGSLHGKVSTNLNKIGIRCVTIQQMQNGGSGPRRDGHGGDSGSDFDDVSFVAPGRRPAEIRVWADPNYVNGMQVKYSNMPVLVNCRITSMKVTGDNIVAERDGLEVMGVATGSSCSSMTQTLILIGTQSSSQSVDVTTTEGGEFNWATSVSISFSFEIGAFETSTLEFGIEQTYGGSKSWSNSKSISSTNETQNSIGTYLYYQGPGSCIAVGYLKRYKINKDSLPVEYSTTCDVGTVSPQPGTIKLSSKVFGKVDFRNFCFTYNSQALCRSATDAKTCVSSTYVNSLLTDLYTVRDSFYSCFNGNSGVFS